MVFSSKSCQDFAEDKLLEFCHLRYFSSRFVSSLGCLRCEITLCSNVLRDSLVKDSYKYTKTRACSMDQILPDGHRISRAKILRKTQEKKTTVSQNKQREIEMITEICKRKQRKGKGKLETSNTKFTQVRASSVSI